jgi:acetyl esterase/lipase
MDIFMPGNTDRPLPVVMFVHGGAFIRSGTSALYPEAVALAKVGWVGISVNYRVNGYPNESNDILTATEWIHSHAAQYHIDPNKIALFGTSAGATLVAQAATVAHQQHRKLGVVAVVSWSGPMDFVSFAHSVANNPHLIGVGTRYMGCPLSSCPSVWSTASPINHVQAGDPPMFLANSTRELVPYSQATSMVSKLQSVGVTAHLFTVHGRLHALQYASQAFQPSINWLTQYLGPIHGALQPVPSQPPAG